MRPDNRHRVTHGLNADGMVACNPRDREAILRAEVADVRTGDIAAVTCQKCLAALQRQARERRPR